MLGFKTIKTTKLLGEYIPPRGDSNPQALLLLVHGRTGNLKLLQWYSKRFNLPGVGYLALQAPFPDQRADQKDPGFSWYLENFQGLDESRELLKLVIKEIQTQGFQKTERIFWFGFSQGGAMGLDLALRSEFPFGGVMCISGFCIQVEDYPEAFGPFAKNQRILATHGTRDRIIPLEQSKPDFDRLRSLGVPLEFQVFDKPHSFHLKTEVPFLENCLKKWLALPKEREKEK